MHTPNCFPGTNMLPNIKSPSNWKEPSKGLKLEKVDMRTSGSIFCLFYFYVECFKGLKKMFKILYRKIIMLKCEPQIYE